MEDSGGVYRGVGSQHWDTQVARQASVTYSRAGLHLPLRCLRRSRPQHQLATGVAQFELPVRVPHIVEGEDPGDRAEQKGSKDSLVLLDDLAFVVSVKNKTVVTAVDSNRAKENVFTNIDSVVIG